MKKRKKTYYEFIYDESERLSRLITNVLQLARMNHDDLQLDMRDIGINELLDNIQSKITSQIEHAGFTLNISTEETETHH